MLYRGTFGRRNPHINRRSVSHRNGNDCRIADSHSNSGHATKPHPNDTGPAFSHP